MLEKLDPVQTFTEAPDNLNLGNVEKGIHKGLLDELTTLLK